MKGLFVFTFLCCMAMCSVNVFAGEKVYRDGEVNPNCEITRSNPVIISPRTGSMPDKARTIHTLRCGGQFVSAVTVPSVVCSPRTGCRLPEFSVCGRAGCQSSVERQANTANYDFNYNLPGVDFFIDGFKAPELLFGTVSKKSSANVFSDRPLSKNYIAYSNDGVLDKPVIIVEGYDPSDSLYPNAYFNAGFNQLLLNGVNNNGGNGRDLFIINLPHGAAKISENAAFLQKIITEINAAKVGNIPAVVIGYSMGGLVARQALKNMEAAGINHKVSLYVSYDSPHMGANSPVALEDTVESIINELDAAMAGYTPSSLKRARYIYNSPAAREMLIAAPDFKAAKPSDFPDKLVRIAITSGSLLGQSVTRYDSVIEGEYVAGFKFSIYDNWWGSWSKSYEWYSRRRAGVYYDNVPGSYAELFRKAYFELKANADSFSEYKVAGHQNITFVPTVSALAIALDANTYVKNIVAVKSPFDKYIAIDGTSGLQPCDIFRTQSASGENFYHSVEDANLHYGQLMQLRCALDTYQVEGVQVPDRSFKRY